MLQIKNMKVHKMDRMALSNEKPKEMKGIKRKRKVRPTKKLSAAKGLVDQPVENKTARGASELDNATKTHKKWVIGGNRKKIATLGALDTVNISRKNSVKKRKHESRKNMKKAEVPQTALIPRMAGGSEIVQSDEKSKQNATGSKAAFEEQSTIFVGNLPITIKRNELAALFAAYSPIGKIRLRTVSGLRILKHEHRRMTSSLNAYVQLGSPNLAERALNLNGILFQSKHIRVTRAQLPIRKFRNFDTKRIVFVGNLRYDANEEKLHTIFSGCGEIEYVRCIYNADNQCKGFAYVAFQNVTSANLAMELNGTIFDERPLNVEKYSLKKLDNKASATEVKANKAMIKKKLRVGVKKDDNEKKVKRIAFRGVKGIDTKKRGKKKRATPNRILLAKKIAPIKA